jgi:hypothetical protein
MFIVKLSFLKFDYRKLYDNLIMPQFLIANFYSYFLLQDFIIFAGIAIQLI